LLYILLFESRNEELHLVHIEDIWGIFEVADKLIDPFCGIVFLEGEDTIAMDCQNISTIFHESNVGAGNLLDSKILQLWPEQMSKEKSGKDLLSPGSASGDAATIETTAIAAKARSRSNMFIIAIERN